MYLVSGNVVGGLFELHKRKHIQVEVLPMRPHLWPIGFSNIPLGNGEHKMLASRPVVTAWAILVIRHYRDYHHDPTKLGAFYALYRESSQFTLNLYKEEATSSIHGIHLSFIHGLHFKSNNFYRI